MKIETISKEKLETTRQAGENFLLLVGAVWCANCTSLKKALEQDQSLLGHVILQNIPIFYIDIDDFAELAKFYNIKSLPTTFVFKDGKVRDFVSSSSLNVIKDRLISTILWE